MGDFSVISINQTTETIECKVYDNIILTLPNLKAYNVEHESILNFQTKLFYELNNIFWDPYNSPIYIRIDKNTSYITYILRVTNKYMLKNKLFLKDYVNNMLNTFNFKYTSKKRRLYSEDYISHKVQKLDINI